ncbi:MAG: TonB family protein [Candidatus Sulfotelmatobacter sp.]
MRDARASILEQVESSCPELRLLISPEPWPRVFAQNLSDLFHAHDVSPLQVESAPAPFWSDVFVERKLPWRRFLQSGGYHILALILIWGGSRFLALQPQIAPQPAFNHADVVYYTPSEYLPPLDTRRPTSAHAEKADPELSAQPIISVPPEAENHSQTVVTPPNIKLRRDIPLPNTVAWSEKPAQPIAPAPVVLASETSRLAPRMERSVIAPPPDVEASQKSMLAPQPSVIAPPPALEAASNRTLGELNIGRSAVIAPAPQLSLNEQRAISDGRSTTMRSAQVIAPPPSLSASGGSRAAESMIALNLHPAVGAPPESVAGNRRGSFAATPAGHHGASGTPGNSSGASAGDASTGSKNNAGKLPSGLYVGKATSPTTSIAGNLAPSLNANAVNPRLLAGLRRPLISRATTPQSDIKLSEAERTVFGDRKIYSMTLNMPNLNSAGGSWVIHFAALKSESTSASSSGEAASSSDLSSPVATLKVDPAYPLELMKQNVSGTVILHAVILADGTVGTVRVLRSIDDRLDQFASEAIAKWQFQPATKNGAPVAVEATFWIPFRPGKIKSDF